MSPRVHLTFFAPRSIPRPWIICSRSPLPVHGSSVPIPCPSIIRSPMPPCPRPRRLAVHGSFAFGAPFGMQQIRGRRVSLRHRGQGVGEPTHYPRCRRDPLIIRSPSQILVHGSSVLTLPVHADHLFPFFPSMIRSPMSSPEKTDIEKSGTSTQSLRVLGENQSLYYTTHHVLPSQTPPATRRPWICWGPPTWRTMRRRTAPPTSRIMRRRTLRNS